MAKSDATCPADEEIEVSLFGPGYGESVAIHTGHGDWIVVDSCVIRARTRARTPAVLAYLHDIGVDAATAVKLVVSTHWHDDHIRGMAELFRSCARARFSCSQALFHEDFITVALAASDRAMMDSSGFDEFRAVLRELERRKQVPWWALADCPLWQRSGDLPCLVQALSPSDRAVTQAFQSIGQLLDQERSPRRRIPAPERNDGSVAIWLAVGSASVLLGADLLDTGSPDTGWNAVIASPCRPTARARIYKVAHHGARSADTPRIWTYLLSGEPVALLTPFVRGNRALPTSRDIRRLRERTGHVYATARYATDQADFGTGPVGRTKRDVLMSYRRMVESPGQVRIRMSVRESCGRVDLFGSALRLGASPDSTF